MLKLVYSLVGRIGRQPAGVLLAASLALRLVQALLIGTYAAPDEYWQAPEIAHKLVYGVGYVTWEWWPANELRSALHPALLAAGLQLAHAGGVDSPGLVALMPRLVHAALTALTDLATASLALDIFHSPDIAGAALLCQWLSWFVMFAGVRPFANSLEMAQVTCATALWYRGRRGVSPGLSNAHNLSLMGLAALLAGVSVASRPSALVPLAAIGLLTAWRFGVFPAASAFLSLCAPVAIVGFGCCALVDRWFYGHWTFPLVSFIRFNVIEGGDRQYGAYPWYWYLIDGLPAAVGPSLPLVLAGMLLSFAAAARDARRSARKREYANDEADEGARKHPSRSPASRPPTPWRSTLLMLNPELEPLAIIVAVVAALSRAAHKEHRFLAPIAPLLSLYAGRGLWACLQGSREAAEECSGGGGAVDVPPPGGGTEAPGSSEIGPEVIPSPQLPALRKRGAAPGRPTPPPSGRLSAPLSQAGAAPPPPAADSHTAWFSRASRSRGPPPSWRVHGATAAVTLLIVGNVALAAYLNMIHQAGSIAVAAHIARLAEAAERHGAVHAPPGMIMHPRGGPGTSGLGGGLDPAGPADETAQQRARSYRKRRRGAAGAAARPLSGAAVGGAPAGGDEGPDETAALEEEAPELTEEEAVWASVVPQQALMAVHFLAPCHSTPFYSVVHAPIAMLQLDCSPSGPTSPAAPHINASSPLAGAAALLEHDEFAADARAVKEAVSQARTAAAGNDWPAISESAAWLSSPALLLAAMYGPAPEAPLACEYSTIQAAEEHFDAAGDRAPAGGPGSGAGGGAPPTSPRAPSPLAFHQHGDIHLHLSPSTTCCSEDGLITHPDETTFALTAAGFLSVFGSPDLRVRPGAALDFRQLPTHIVMFDVDAARPQVASFLSGAGFAQSASFFYAHVGADAHSRREQEPGRVLLFEHSCWRTLASSWADAAV